MAIFSFASQALLGLDIGPKAIRLVKLRKKKRGFSLHCAATYACPADIFVDYKIKAWDDLCTLLNSIVVELGLRGTSTAIHLPQNLVRCEWMRVLKGMREADIEAEIYTKVQRELPGIHEDLCIDYTEIDKDDTYADIFFVATRQAYLSQYIACVNAAGLHTKIVDVDLYALKRAVSFTLGLSESSSATTVFLYVDHVATLIAFNQSAFLFHQDFEISTHTIFVMELKKHLQRCFSTIGSTHDIVICMQEPYRTLFCDHFRFTYPITMLNPFNSAQFFLAESIDGAWLNDYRQEFLLALGLALREVPKW